MRDFRDFEVEIHQMYGWNSSNLPLHFYDFSIFDSKKACNASKWPIDIILGPQNKLLNEKSILYLNSFPKLFGLIIPKFIPIQKYAIPKRNFLSQWRHCVLETFKYDCINVNAYQKIKMRKMNFQPSAISWV